MLALRASLSDNRFNFFVLHARDDVALPTAIFMNSSKSNTGLFTSLQHDQDLRPSWNTGAPGW